MSARYGKVGISDIAFLLKTSNDSARTILADAKAGKSITRVVGGFTVSVIGATEVTPVWWIQTNTLSGDTVSSDRRYQAKK